MVESSNPTLYWNLFVSSKTSVNLLPVNRVALEQTTDYPWSGKSTLKITEILSKAAPKFTLKIRIPGWAKGQPVPSDLYVQTVPSSVMEVSVAVNGKAVNGVPGKDGYLAVEREWKVGDAVEVNLPMPVKRIRAHEKVAADRGRLAVERGPLVYCAEGCDNGDTAYEAVLPANATFKETQIAFGDKTVTGLRASTGLVLIPYCLWNNRKPGNPMQVWFCGGQDACHPGLPECGTVNLEGDYPGHLQDVWYDGSNAIYWAHTEDLVKTDLTGKILKHAHVEGHHACIELKDGKLYIAVCQMQNKTHGQTTPDCRVTIGEYDAETLELVQMHVTDINDRSGSLAILDDGTFVIGCLRPKDIAKTQVRFHHLDRNFKLIKSYVHDNVPVKLGIEVIKKVEDGIVLCPYGDKEFDAIWLDRDFKEVRRGKLGGSCGLVFDGDDVWVGKTWRSKETKRYMSRLVKRR